ncbi:Ribonuclease H domain, partial [Arabidopsis suecica]
KMDPNPTGNSLDGSSSDSYFFFKGSLAGFGVTICREEDDSILFQKKVSLHYSDISGWETELMALKLGLTKAVSLGINHITICCCDPEIFEFVMERSVPHHEKFALLMDDVHSIRQQFTSSIPILVTGKQATFAYKLAKETLISRNIRPMPRTTQKKTTQKKTCGICFVDDIEGPEMF